VQIKSKKKINGAGIWTQGFALFWMTDESHCIRLLDEMGRLANFLPGLASEFLISVSQVASITGMNHMPNL
jgi:hypothetical protein